MHRTQLLQELTTYKASTLITPEEGLYYKQFLNFIATNPQCFERSNKGHITSSIWVVSHDGNKVLLTQHKKLNLWLQLGGHNDGDSQCKTVALKEAEEESGIIGLEFVMPAIFDIDVHVIPSACEYHYDIRYLLRAPKDAQFIISEESHNLVWIEQSKIAEYNSARSIIRMAEKFTKHFC